jgi:hypothetical protein
MRSSITPAEGPAEARPKAKSRTQPSVAKKPSARRNLRHGLAIISIHNPALWPEIERIAKAICNGDGNPLLFEQATVIAEAKSCCVVCAWKSSL